MYELPKLNYNYNNFEPYFDVQTMEIHYTKHHQAYVDNLNTAMEKLKTLDKEFYNEISEIKQRKCQRHALKFLLENLDRVPAEIKSATQNNAGGHANHGFFWRELTNQPTEISSELLSAIEHKFGSLEDFKSQFKQVALGRFGSGWAWLVKNSQNQLEIISTANQDSPISLGLTPILGLDVWEHAYYLNYQNRRGDYIDNFWKIVDWNFVSENYAK